MGIGLAEYRAAIGLFAPVAANAGLRRRSKAKQKRKSNRLGEEDRQGKHEEGGRANNFQGERRWMSLDRQRPREISKCIERRSQTLNHKDRSCIPFSCGSRSPSHKRKTNRDIDVNLFTKYCIDCKTKVFDKMWQRGRSRQRWRQQCTITLCGRHCPSDNSEVVVKLPNDISNFLTCTAAYQCILLEQAIFTVVQMLLLQAGIESNPGPTSPTSSPCGCNASQHFNRVKNVIAEAQGSFQSKITQDTLTKKAVEIQETGSSW